MHQFGPNNQGFVQLLKRLRVGACTLDDYQALNGRVASNVCPDWDAPCWRDAPIIVSSNRVKDLLNEQAAQAFTARTGQVLQWYYCSDSRAGNEISDPSIY